MQEVRRYGQKGGRCGILCLDLDRFKAINDALGHLTGDALLVAVSKRLASLLRPHDIVARLGGDEFAIVQLHIRAERDCGSLAIKSTAEGLETHEQLRILEQENCDSVQGYLISRPVHAEQVRAMLGKRETMDGSGESKRAA